MRRWSSSWAKAAWEKWEARLSFRNCSEDRSKSRGPDHRSGHGRMLAAAALTVMTVAVAGCQSQEVPPWMQQQKGVEGPAAAPGPASALPPPVGEVAPDKEPSAYAYENLGAPGSQAMARVALLVPLSGPQADVGKALLNAAQMAVFDVANDNFVLQPYDSTATPDGARDAAAKAVAEGAQLLLGPVFAGSVTAVAPQARAGNVRMIAFSTDPAVAGAGVYVAGFLLREQARRVVEHARSQGVERFAALAPDTAFGRQMTEAYRRAVERTGGRVTRVEYYPTDPEGVTAAVQRLGDYEARKAALEEQRRQLEQSGDAAAQEALLRLEGMETFGDLPFDAVLLPEGAQRLKEVAALLPYYDIDPAQVKVMGPMLWADLQLANEPALVGAWYPAPAPATHESFTGRYRALYGSEPPAIASLGYDTTALAAVLARQGGPAAFTDRALTDPSGFAGVDGLFRFLEDGTSERGFAVMEVRPGGAVEVAPAPRDFAPLPSTAGSLGYLDDSTS